MIGQSFGGNEVTRVNLASDKFCEFAASPYVYRYYRLEAEGSLVIDGLSSFTIFCMPAAEPSRVVVDEDTLLYPGDVAQVQGRSASLKAHHAAAILVAGLSGPSEEAGGVVTVTRADKVKKVVKPWGHELWIAGEHSGYALKQIAISAPHKTSLQYHHFKSETNVLFSGRAKLHYKASDTDNSRLTQADISSVELSIGSVINVQPPVIHRIEAVTDLMLYEVSTPHLDDVVRVQDDANRPDGRIEAEHQGQPCT